MTSSTRARSFVASRITASRITVPRAAAPRVASRITASPAAGPRIAASRVALCVWATLALAPARHGFAAEADCKPLFDAITRLFNTPSHQYLSQTSAVTGDKVTLSEIINTGKAMFIRVDGKWHTSTITAAQLQQQEEENRKNAKVTICRIVSDESVDGVAVTHFSSHTETGYGASDQQLWISKSAGLPVRETIDMDMGARGGKSHAEIRVVYSGIDAPTVGL
ncbi:MAG: hypothetical protein QOD56_2937 [Gammaproteobacteria bacterium]|nr:hypothetical protein [Gammaproteobacteria bacterium]